MIEPRASCVVSMHSTRGTLPSPFILRQDLPELRSWPQVYNPPGLSSRVGICHCAWAMFLIFFCKHAHLICKILHGSDNLRHWITLDIGNLVCYFAGLHWDFQENFRHLK